MKEVELPEIDSEKLKKEVDELFSNEEKKKLYALVNGMLEEFREKNGSTVCRELLKGIKTSPVPSERTDEYYRTRPCVRFVESAARIVSKTFEI